MMGFGAAIDEFSFWGRCYVKWPTSTFTTLTFYFHCFASSEIVNPLSAPTVAALFTFAHSVSFRVSLNFNLLFCDSRFLFFLFIPMLVATIEGFWVSFVRVKWFTSTALTFCLLCKASGFVVPP